MLGRHFRGMANLDLVLGEGVGKEILKKKIAPQFNSEAVVFDQE